MPCHLEPNPARLSQVATPSSGNCSHLHATQQSNETEYPAEKDHGDDRQHHIVRRLDVHHNSVRLMSRLDQHCGVAGVGGRRGRGLVAPLGRGRIGGGVGRRGLGGCKGEKGG